MARIPDCIKNSRVSGAIKSHPKLTRLAAYAVSEMAGIAGLVKESITPKINLNSNFVNQQYNNPGSPSLGDYASTIFYLSLIAAPLVIEGVRYYKSKK